MKTLGYTSTLALSLALSFGLMGCGGGGGSDSAPATDTSGGGTTKTVSFSGTAVDGYISGGIACLDKNINGICDSGEPTAPTNANGKFTFTDVTVDKGVLLPVIVTGGTDTATNKPFEGFVSNIIHTDDIATNKSFTASPLTDLIATSFIASNDKSPASLVQIKTNVASSLNISVEKVDSDPVQDKEVFAKAQEVQQTKKLILTAATKANSGSLNADELVKSVREAMAKSVQGGTTLSSADVVTKLKETQPTVAIPSNETDFIANQTTEIKKALATIVTDTSITVDTLDQQQSNIETAVESASANIENATDGSVITVVEVAPVTPPVTPPVTTPIATTLATPPAVPAL